MLRPVAVCVALVASAAWADSSPVIVAAPLAVHRSPGGETTKALQKELRLQLAKQSNVLTPTPSAWDAAVTQLNRQDCDSNDDCLRELAVTAGALYAIHAMVETDLTKKNVIAEARVVRRDGVLVEIAGERICRVQLNRGSDSFEAVAKVALAQLLRTMKLGELPSTLPSAEQHPPKETPDAGVAVTQVTPEVTDAGIPPPPPLVIETPGPSSARIASYGLMGVGAASVVVGGVFGILAASDRGNIKTDPNGNLQPSQVSTQQGVDRNATVAAVTLTVGAACLAAGITLFVMSPAPDDHTVLSVTPTVVPGGAAVMVGGRFP